MTRASGYDLIGDIHGYSVALEGLLQAMGYTCDGGIYRHPTRRVIFLGDFIDRGPDQRGVIEIVRPMVEAGTALSVMGNHEYNAISWATQNSETGDYLRPHTQKNRRQHEAFLAAYADDPEAYRGVIEWFKTLPLWLELEGLRVVHACWDPQWITRLREAVGPGNRLTDDLLHQGSKKGAWQYDALETLLKGKEIPLQDGHSFRDKDGNIRHHIRIRWWDQSATTYRAAFMGPDSALTHIPEDEVSGDHLIEYSEHEPPVFLGHYWLEGTPAPLAPNIACLDYSVAKPGGKLVAYRWSGERRLVAENYVIQ